MAEPQHVTEAEYAVVVNDEEQYSIWAAARSIPLGWREAGFRGSQAQCLAHIKEVWTDMRPLSVRGGMPDKPAAK